MPIQVKARILISAVHSGREGERGKTDHSAAIDEIDDVMSDRSVLALADSGRVFVISFH